MVLKFTHGVKKICRNWQAYNYYEWDEYLNDRLNNQIDWYDGKSQTNQKWFKRLRLLEIIAAAIIPFLAGIGA